jgi:hypothetical protein
VELESGGRVTVSGDQTGAATADPERLDLDAVPRALRCAESGDGFEEVLMGIDVVA